MAPDHPLSREAAVTPDDLARHPFIGLERGTRLGEAVRDSFSRAGVPFGATVEVRYCNTACVLAGAGVGVAVVDPFSPSQGGAHPVVVRPFVPRTPVEAFMLWSEAEPLSRLAQAFLAEVRAAARGPSS